MLSAVELDAQWQAIRYAIDMIDMNWNWDSIDPTEYPNLYNETKSTMQKHRQTLIDLQEKILADTRIAKNREANQGESL